MKWRYLLFPLTALLWVVIKAQTIRNAWQIHRMETRYARTQRQYIQPYGSGWPINRLPEHRKAANSP